MKFHVLLQRREGRMIPRWQMGAVHSIYGELTIADDKDAQLNRRTLTARLKDQNGKDLLPRLLDASVLYVNHNTMVISGFETSFDERSYAQTWMLSVDESFLHSMHWRQRA